MLVAIGGLFIVTLVWLGLLLDVHQRQRDTRIARMRARELADWKDEQADLSDMTEADWQSCVAHANAMADEIKRKTGGGLGYGLFKNTAR